MNQQQPRPSFIESFRFIQGMMQYFAITPMVFLRRGIGYRLLHPLKLLAITGAVIVIAVLATPDNEDARTGDLLVFAILSFVFGCCHRVRRWIDINRGINHLSLSVGTSIFHFNWLPYFIRKNHRIERYFDPILVAAVGLLLFQVSRALGIYLVFAAFSLRGYQDQIFQRERDRDLDLIDSVLIAQNQIHTLEQFQQAENSPQQPSQNIPAGPGSDIADRIRQQKQRRDSRRA